VTGALFAHLKEGRQRLRKARLRAHRAWQQRHDPVIRPHIGQAIERRLLLGGRVLREGAPLPATASTPRWRNLLNTYRSFVHVKIAGARLLASFGDAQTEVVTDGDGYFSLELEMSGPVAGPLWQEVVFRLLEAPDYSGPPVEAKGLVLVHPLKARFAVISDIDDTVLASNVTSKLRMMARVLLSNAHTRMPFAGVGAFYRALEAGNGNEHNPIFYVSNGPWNLHDLLVDFFRLNGIPLGPISLRDWGAHLVLARKPTGAHKRAQIAKIMAFFPKVPVVLIGDSGEHDPEIFSRIAREFPGRVQAIYIRCVGNDPARRESMRQLGAALAGEGVDFRVVNDSEEAALHAAGKGLIPADSVESVRHDKLEDRLKAKGPSESTEGPA
jgi:phosphatidate phosphatase APP1